MSGDRPDSRRRGSFYSEASLPLRSRAERRRTKLHLPAARAKERRTKDDNKQNKKNDLSDEQPQALLRRRAFGAHPRALERRRVDTYVCGVDSSWGARRRSPSKRRRLSFCGDLFLCPRGTRLPLRHTPHPHQRARPRGDLVPLRHTRPPPTPARPPSLHDRSTWKSLRTCLSVRAIISSSSVMHTRRLLEVVKTPNPYPTRHY